jgi:RNA polymerase sigma-70 factor (ECF subfamily)
VTENPSAQPALTPVETETLMSRYQQGDSEAASILITRVSPQIFQFYLAQVRNRAQAEDLLQDFWLRIHSARRTYRPGEPVLPWLYAIARRVQIDDYRRWRRTRSHELQTEQLPDRPTAESAPSRVPDMSDLLKDLPEAQKQAVLLLKVAGLSLEEVARATGTTVGSVKQRAHRAYSTLRKTLGRQE